MYKFVTALILGVCIGVVGANTTIYGFGSEPYGGVTVFNIGYDFYPYPVFYNAG